MFSALKGEQLFHAGRMLKKSAILEKAEVKVEAELGSDCPHPSLSLSLDLSLPRFAILRAVLQLS